MAYESRNGRQYYYRKVWRDGTCRSEYIGSGETAALIAQLDSVDQERRQLEAAQQRQARAEFAELARTPPELAALLSDARRATAEALEAAGYHQHKRQWRKQRGNKNQSQVAE